MFGILKSWMGHTHFITRQLPQVGVKMNLNVLARNGFWLKRMAAFFISLKILLR